MKTLTDYELSFRSGRTKLTQLEHLENCIKDMAVESVWLIEPFAHWQPYVTGTSGQLALYAHQDWKNIDCLIDVVENQTCDWVYMAVNRYLLLCDPDSNALTDWDQAILEYFQQNLKRYSIVDYKYQPLNYTGCVGNFVVPDNRILCKKVK
tara:strand:+ start:1884 stop:2336 length:453 start_codon:yes stop_codon:yes gene_type:complete